MALPNEITNVWYGKAMLNPEFHARLNIQNDYANITDPYGMTSQKIPVRQVMDLNGHPVLDLKQIARPMHGFQAATIEAKIDIAARPMVIPHLRSILGVEFEADMRAVIKRLLPNFENYALARDANLLVVLQDVPDQSQLDRAYQEILYKVEDYRGKLIDDLFTKYCGNTPRELEYEAELGVPNPKLHEGIRRMREERLIRKSYDTWDDEPMSIKQSWEISREMREKAAKAEAERIRITEEKERNRIIEEEAAAIVARDALESNPYFGGF